MNVSPANASRFVVPALAGPTLAATRASETIELSSRKLPLRAKARTTNLAARLAVGAALIALHPAAHACAVCFGKSDSALAKGMNMGIFTLLLFIGGVLAALSCFFVFLAVRSSRHPQNAAAEAAPNSPHNPAHS